MKITPIHTRRLEPPQDDLFDAIRKSKLSLKERDVVVVSSKVVAIHEGRCVPTASIPDKEDLVKKEADVYVKKADSRWRITLKHGTFLSSAGIDESNANNHYILLPEDPNKNAKALWEFFKQEYDVAELGVIIADSHSTPLRYGSMGVTIGWWGFEPITYYTGKPDLFGRAAQFTRINVADSLAAAGVFVTGELAEQTPLAVISDAPHITFSTHNTTGDLLIPPREDIFWPFLKNLYEE